MSYTPNPVATSDFDKNGDGWTGEETSDSIAFKVCAVGIIDYDKPPKKDMIFTTPVAPVPAPPAPSRYYFKGPDKYLNKGPGKYLDAKYKFMLYEGKICFDLTLTGKPGTPAIGATPAVPAPAVALNNVAYNLILVGGDVGSEITVGYDIMNGKAAPLAGGTKTYNIEVPISNTAAGVKWKKFSGGNWNTDATEDEIKKVLEKSTKFLIRADCATNLEKVLLEKVALLPRVLPGEPMPLEIHTINVSQGDSILIIHRDLYELERKIDESAAHKADKPADSNEWMPFAVKKGIDIEGTVKKAVIIDGGDSIFVKNVVKYMEKLGVKNDAHKGDPTKVDYDTLEKLDAVVTHYHADHYGSFLFNLTKKYKVDEVPVLKHFQPAIVYDCGLDGTRDPVTKDKKSSSKEYKKYRDNIKEITVKGPSSNRAMSPGDKIDLDEDQKQINLFCVASNGLVWSGRPGAGVAIDLKPPPRTEEQNSRSIALILEFGDFRYYLAGDLGGVQKKTKAEGDGLDYGTKKTAKDGSYWDIEIPLAKNLPGIYPKDKNRAKTEAGHMCGLKCSHHGSQLHTNTFLLQKLQPKVCTISSGYKIQFHAHPTQEVLCRVDYDNSDVVGAAPAKKQYSPKWPDDTSGAPGPVINNTLTEAGKTPKYYVNEMRIENIPGSKHNPLEREYPNGLLIGTTVIRPYLSDILKIEQNKPKVTTNEIRMQVYGYSDYSDVHMTNKYDDKLEDPEGKNVNYPATNHYPVGPWVHTCDKH
jgi:beta-lactamase superfamily II metal-dependent hydrolase